MLLIIALIAVCLFGLHAPRILVAALAMVLAVNLALGSRRAGRRMLVAATPELDFDRKPSRTQRRQMRKGLRLALDQTEFRSLFPTTMTRSDAVADWWLARQA